MGVDTTLPQHSHFYTIKEALFIYLTFVYIGWSNESSCGGLCNICMGALFTQDNIITGRNPFILDSFIACNTSIPHVSRFSPMSNIKMKTKNVELLNQKPINNVNDTYVDITKLQ